MDIDSLRPLLSLLLYGVLFFFMMRFGCGAHMMGGHHHGGGHGHGAPEGAQKDPVCGMDVDPHNAKAATVHGGRTFYFCSPSCRDKFEREPDRYLSGSAAGVHHHG